MRSILPTIFIIISYSNSFANPSDPLSQVTWNGKIIGGTTAYPGQLPYQVSLRRTRDFITKHICGGSIYNKNWIITAGHCLLYFNGIYEATVVVGTVDLESNGISYDVEKLFVHPGFDKVLKMNDLGLVQTRTPIKFNLEIEPIPLSYAYMESDREAITSGWGRVTIQGGRTSHLQYLNVTIMDNEECRQAHRISKRSVFIYDNVLCTRNIKMKGTCNCDSGGPLVVNGKLVGVVSWGIRCAIGLPDVFTRISEHSKWIEMMINAEQ